MLTYNLCFAAFYYNSELVCYGHLQSVIAYDDIDCIIINIKCQLGG